MDVPEEPSYPLRYRLYGGHDGEILVKATTRWTEAKEQIALALECDSSRVRLINGGRVPVDEDPIGPPPWAVVHVVLRHMDAVRREQPAEQDNQEHASDGAEQHGEVVMMTMPFNPLRMGVGHLSFISEQWRPRPLFVSMSDESQEGPMGSGVGSTLNESIGSIVDELRMGGLGLGGQMQNLTMNIQFEEERPQEPPQDEQPEPQETSDHPTPAAATGQSEGRARRRSRIIVRRRERRRQGERAGLSLPMLSAELHTRVQDFASSTSSTLLAAGRALVAAGISLDPAGGSVTLEEETNTSDPTEEPLPRLMQYPIPSLAEVRGLLPWRELYQLETVLEDSLGMDLAHRQPGQHHWNDFNARFLIVSTTVTLLHHRLQQWLERMENVGFIRSYVNAMTLLSAIHARLAVLSAQVFGSLSRSLPPEALEQEWTDEAPLDVGNPQEPAELELPPPLDEQTSAEKDVLEDVAPEENLQEIEHGRAVVPDATLSPVPDPRLSPLHGASSYDDAKSRDVGVQEAPPLVSRPLPVPLSDTNADEPADFDRALSTLGPGTQTLAKKWLHDPAEFSKKVMKRARCTQHSDSYLSGDWPESSSNERLASPEMLLSLNLNKALAKAGCESQAVSSAVREAYILEVLLRIAKKAVTNPDYAEMEAALPNLRMIVDLLKRESC